MSIVPLNDKISCLFACEKHIVDAGQCRCLNNVNINKLDIQKPLKVIITKVVHCKKAKHDVYIGRPSKWGNPYTHKTGTRAEFILPTREEAIEAYRHWITEGGGKHLLNDLHELKGKKLGCWCKPQSCHGDILVELIELHCKE